MDDYSENEKFLKDLAQLDISPLAFNLVEKLGYKRFKDCANEQELIEFEEEVMEEIVDWIDTAPGFTRMKIDKDARNLDVPGLDLEPEEDNARERLFLTVSILPVCLLDQIVYEAREHFDKASPTVKGAIGALIEEDSGVDFSVFFMPLLEDAFKEAYEFIGYVKVTD